MWNCQCDCGVRKAIRGQALRVKHEPTFSCGCKARNGRFRDLTGKKFGRLMVIEIAERERGKKSKWLCRCDCGNTKIVQVDSLNGGGVKSCGCLKIENSRRSTRGIPRRNQATVPGSRRTEYRIFYAMHRRCDDKNCSGYSKYGARGIRVCERWSGKNGFDNFFADMGRRPSPDHTLDRKENNGHYGPGNVKWATIEKQSRNKRSNILLAYKGQTKAAADWADEYEIPRGRLYARLRRGWSLERAITCPVVS